VTGKPLPTKLSTIANQIVDLQTQANHIVDRQTQANQIVDQQTHIVDRQTNNNQIVDRQPKLGLNLVQWPARSATYNTKWE
jgi:hypothetical protein